MKLSFAIASLFLLSGCGTNELPPLPDGPPPPKDKGTLDRGKPADLAADRPSADTAPALDAVADRGKPSEDAALDLGPKDATPDRPADFTADVMPADFGADAMPADFGADAMPADFGADAMPTDAACQADASIRVRSSMIGVGDRLTGKGALDARGGGRAGTPMVHRQGGSGTEGSGYGCIGPRDDGV
jgi:hypothetical protein